MSFITLDDFIDTYFKVVQRGNGFFLSKLTFNKEKRTKSAFNNSSFQSSNFWSIPKVKERWNTLITGDKKQDYISYLINTTLKDKKDLKLLSIGSGISNTEIELAKNTHIFKKITCLDIAENLLEKASTSAKKQNLTNIEFIAKSIYDIHLNEQEFDVVFFKASLHHFDKIDSFLANRIKPLIKPNGLLIINEFVGATRHQFSKNQIAAINKAIALIPKKYRVRFKSRFLKNKYRGVGTLRMKIADPSECVDSSSIMPSIHNHFNTVLEKPYGGNLLMSAFRDISHHFYDIDKEKQQILEEIFLLEDEFLKHNPSDFVFGIYQNNN